MAGMEVGRSFAFRSLAWGVAMSAFSMGAAQANPAPVDDRQVVAALDIEYQAAVKRNDFETMDRILHPHFVLVRGDGRVVTRDDIVEGARSGAFEFEVQDEIEGTQIVRTWGDSTAVVTALLWVKGTHMGEPFDRRVWFSDTYVRTGEGWRYAFAQVSLPLP